MKNFFHLASQDYIASNQTLTFTTPERNCIRIEIVDDSEVEGSEQFWVYLTVLTDTGSEVLSRCGSVYIADNDGKKEELCVRMSNEPLNEYIIQFYSHQLALYFLYLCAS